MPPQVVRPPETSTLSLSPEGLSIHMRIPADRLYLANAMLTLREICDHLNLDCRQSNRISLVMEEALLNSMEHAYPAAGGDGQIDLQFTVEGDEFLVVVEDFGRGIPSGRESEYIADDSILNDRGRGLCILRGLSDKSAVTPTSQGTRATMLFYLPTNA